MPSATQQQLDDLVARGLPLATLETLRERLHPASFVDGLAPAICDTLTAHLAHYLATVECPICGGRAFTWGLQYGVGKCVHCTYPGRMYHTVLEPVLPDTLCDDCGRPRAEHLAAEEVVMPIDPPGEPYGEEYPRCPGSEYERFRAPVAVKFELLLWANPAEVVKPKTEAT